MNEELNANLIVEEEKQHEDELPEADLLLQTNRASTKRKTADIFSRKTAELKTPISEK
jgi:hypothetical protein